VRNVSTGQIAGQGALQQDKCTLRRQGKDNDNSNGTLMQCWRFMISLLSNIQFNTYQLQNSNPFIKQIQLSFGRD
jgi:hypothetical protein